MLAYLLPIDQKIVGDWLITNITIRATINNKIRALIVCWNLKTIGLPEIVPCSFPNARIDPENVMAPIKVPILISTKLLVPIEPKFPIPKDAGS